MSTDSIANVRQMFESELLVDDSLYHPVDVARVRTEDWQIKRFLMSNDGDESEALQAMTRALKWKKSYGVHELTGTMFPLSALNQLELAGHDKQGCSIYWEKLHNQTPPEMVGLMEKFFVFTLERYDRAAMEKGFTVVVDFNGVGVPDLDMDNVKSKRYILHRYPFAVRAWYFVDVSPLLSPILTMFINVFAPELRQSITFCTRAELVNYIDEQHLCANLGHLQPDQDTVSHII